MDVTSSLHSEMTQILRLAGALAIGFFCGILTMALGFFCLFNEYTKALFVLQPKKPVNVKPVALSPLLQSNLISLDTGAVSQTHETCVYINAILMFMFKEWRDTAEVHRWVLKKINVELVELMETKTASRLLQAIKIHELNLGPNVPVIHRVRIVEPRSFSNGQLPQSVVLDVDIEYEGGFLLAVDVDLVFGKSAFISVGIKYMKGCARIQFGRLPCTHWFVSFTEEPILKFDVDTSFESRKLPQLGTLLTNQIQRMIKRKHTYPHYKLRYNPFFSFQHSSQHLFDQNIDDIIVNFNVLEVTIVAFSRLAVPFKKENISTSVVFATLSIDATNCETVAAIRVFSEQKDAIPANFDENSISNEDLKTSAVQTIATKEIVSLKTPANVDTSVEDHRNNFVVENSDPMPCREIFRRSSERESTRKENRRVKTVAKKKEDTSTSESPSYMMVTRNFSAILHEVAIQKPNNLVNTTVNVLSITGNISPATCGIRVGDRILEINGQRILSLSQAIAIIENVRSQKEKFQFKVQRNRQKDNNQRFDPSIQECSKNSGSETESDYSEVDSDEYNDILHVDQKIKEIQEELEAESSILNSPTLESTTNLHGFVKEQVNLPNRNMCIEQTRSSTRAEDYLKYAQLFHDSHSKVFKTSACGAATIESNWNNENFSFQVTEEHKYLNIRFWYDEVNKGTKPLLIGNLGIPLCELELYCNMITANKFTRMYKLSAPLHQDIRLNINEAFMKRSAFRKEYCFGDATVSVKVRKEV